MAGAAPLPLRRHLFQDLSLPSQPRDRSRTLSEILGDEGVTSGSSVGVIGWKPFADRSMLDVAILPGRRAAPTDRSRRDRRERRRPAHRPGRRSPRDQRGRATRRRWRRQPARRRAASTACWTGLRPGIRERDAVALLGWDGTPLSCHLMLTAGPRAAFGLLSPGDRRDRARRPVHGGVRYLGRTQLSGRVRGRGCRAASRDDPRLRGSARRAVLRRGRRVVRGAADRCDGRRAPRHHRAPSRRPVLRHLPEPGPPDRARAAGESHLRQPPRAGPTARSTGTPPVRSGSCTPSTA